MSRRTAGWVFVVIQIALLVALVALPARDDWPTPDALVALSFAFTLSGFAVIAIAALRLGPALTASPVPNQRAVLSRTGPYRLVRHPIYSGLLLVVVGVTLRSGSSIVLAVGIATVAFFGVKARWEERRLTERFAEYDAYAATTPRFVPTPRGLLAVSRGRERRRRR